MIYIMSNKISKFDCFQNRHLIKITSILISAVLIFAMSACHKDESDDNTMTNTLLNDYMNSLCDFDINAMNKNNLSQIEDYSDSDGTKSACKVLAKKINWSIESVNINGSTAIAQVAITLPDDIEGICSSALSDAMMQLEQGSDKTTYELIQTQIEKYADSADTREISAEISMSKVGNKWFISQSLDTTSIISDIRTPVAAVYSIIEQ